MARYITELFICQNPECSAKHSELVDFTERDLPIPCPICSGDMLRGFDVPNIRTEKLSKTFLDRTSAGGGRPVSDGFEDFKKIAELQVKQLKYRPDSEEYKQTKIEIEERKKIKPATGV